MGRIYYISFPDTERSVGRARRCYLGESDRVCVFYLQGTQQQLPPCRRCSCCRQLGSRRGKSGLAGRWSCRLPQRVMKPLLASWSPPSRSCQPYCGIERRKHHAMLELSLRCIVTGIIMSAGKACLETTFPRLTLIPGLGRSFVLVTLFTGENFAC